MKHSANHWVLLDRDGVINRDLPGSVCRSEDFQLLPGAAEAIAALNRKGYRVLVISNQACVGRGDLAPAELEAIHAKMLQWVRQAGGRIERVYVCPHVDEDQCDCRKPRSGLIEQARADFGFDCRETWLVGDAERDVEAARNAGCRPALVRSGKSLACMDTGGLAVFEDLGEFARSIEDRSRST